MWPVHAGSTTLLGLHLTLIKNSQPSLQTSTMPPPPAKPPVDTAYLDALDITSTPRPFKNPHYKPRKHRQKTLKQILSDATRSQNPSEKLTSTYANIESAPSFHPSRGGHWCDVTGLPAKYLDPKSKLRYADKEVYALVRGLGAGVGERYLEVRGANVVLR